MRYPNEVYEPDSREDWERFGGPPTLDKVSAAMRDEFAHQHGGRQPSDIEEFRLWFDGLTPKEMSETLCHAFRLVKAFDQQTDQQEETND